MRRTITKEFYEALVDAFRSTPGNFAATRDTVKKDPRSHGICSQAVVKKAWSEGWPDLDLKPVKEVLRLEEFSARKLLEKQRQLTEEQILVDIASDESLLKEKARRDAITARAAETYLVRIARENVIELLSNSKELLKGFGKTVPAVTAYLEKLDVYDDKSAERAVQLLWKLAISSRAAVESGIKCLQMERLLLGQPTEIIGVKDLESIGDEDALKELDEAVKCAERVRERRRRRQEENLTN